MNISKDELCRLRQQVMERDFSRMNSRQQQAVFSTEGPLLVLAGAGSGKTTVLVNRIANIVRYGQAYHSPFVNSQPLPGGCRILHGLFAGCGAARSPALPAGGGPLPALAGDGHYLYQQGRRGAERPPVPACWAPGGEEVWASTFHSSCARMLRRDGDRLGYTSHFTIYDTDDSRRLMKDVLKDLDIPERALSVRGALAEISRAKDQLTSPRGVRSKAPGTTSA